MLKNLSLIALMTFSASALTADCEPTPTEPDQWSNGDYFIESAYTFSFQDAPYILTIDATTSGEDAQGNVEGTYNWVFWLNQNSFDRGNPPDCIFTEMLVGEATEPQPGSIDYGTCDGCDPFSMIHTVYAESLGDNCNASLFRWWYFDESIDDFDFEDDGVWGYRHADDEGWPSEFSTIEDYLDSGEWEGTLYDLLLSSDGTTFAPLYIVSPLDSSSAQRSDWKNDAHTQIEVSGPAAFRH